MEKKIVYIRTEELFPHPDNPRKDLGDLTELSESIRQQGVLQNLTVVPLVRNITDDEWRKYAELYKECPTEELRQIMNTREMTDPNRYTVIIGHRRLAAAKLAGLEELPCVVAKMTPLEQVRTMAVENMQRADLKPYEEADSFQLMLDLGDTKESISERTGFSRSTIDKRLRLLKYDRVKLKSAMDRGGTLQDYLDLEKVEDEGKRTEVLNFIGTADFKNKLKEAVDDQDRRKRKAGFVAAVKKFAKPFPKNENVYGSAWEKVASYSFWREEDTAESVKAPEDAGKEAYYYNEEYSGVSIYRKKRKAAPVKRPEAEIRYEAWMKEARERLTETARRHRELRLEFVKGVTETALSRDYLYMKVAEAAAVVFSECTAFWIGGSGEAWKELTGFRKNGYYAKPKEAAEAMEAVRREPMRMLLFGVVDRLEGTGVREFWEMDWKDGFRVAEPAAEGNGNVEAVKMEYEILEGLGYEMSEEEQKAMDGSLVRELLEGAPKLPGQKAEA